MLVADESVLVGLFSIFTGKECGRMCNVTVKYLLRAIMIPKWLFLPAVFRPFRTVFSGLGAGFLNLAGQTERTAKKRGKNGEKWARNGLKRVGAS